MHVALLAGQDGYREAILLWRERAGCVWGVSAGGIVELVEIENEIARLIETMVREAGVQIAASFKRGVLAGLVAQNEEQLVLFARLDHRLQAKRLAVENKRGETRRGQVKRGAENGGNLLYNRRFEWGPLRNHAETRVRLVP